MHRNFISSVLLVVFLMLCHWTPNAWAQSPAPPPADEWLTRKVQPGFVATNLVAVADSGALRAEALVGKMKVYWTPPAAQTVKAARLWASADSPGQWQARNWQSLPMEKRGDNWETIVPIENVDIPLVYFIEAQKPAAFTTAARICRPRIAGLDEPSRIFWPFMEGFEEELWSWRMVTDTPDFHAVEVTNNVKSGKAALSLKIPVGKHSVTVATTRIRGWQLEQQFARGIRIWARTKEGTAQIRCTLQAHAFTPKQVVVVYPEESTLNPQWLPVDLMLNKMPKLPLGDVDLVTLEIIGNGPLEVYVDDVQLLGRWQTVD